MKTFWIIISLCLGIQMSYSLEKDLSISQDPKEKPAIQNPKAEKLAEAFDVTLEYVQGLKTDFKIGYGGISHALAMAEKTELSAEEILKMKTEENKGWGVIARELGLKPGKAWKKMEVAEARLEKKQKKIDKAEEKAQRKLEKAVRKAEKKKGKRRGKP